MTYKFTWHRDDLDARDHYCEVPMMESLPPSVDLRPGCPSVYDQSSVGSCTAQAIAGVLQYDEIKQNKSNKNTPSRLFIYYNERTLQNTINSDSGASLRTGIQSVAQFGFCDEELWPYNITKWKNKPSSQAYKSALTGRISHYSRLLQNLNQLKTMLASENPFVFGFSVYDPFMSQSVKDTGILPMPSGRLLGGHAIMCVGYDDKDQTFLIRNSWGSGWGLSGYFKMPYQYALNSGLAADFWAIQFVP